MSSASAATFDKITSTIFFITHHPRLISRTPSSGAMNATQENEHPQDKYPHHCIWQSKRERPCLWRFNILVEVWGFGFERWAFGFAFRSASGLRVL